MREGRRTSSPAASTAPRVTPPARSTGPPPPQVRVPCDAETVLASPCRPVKAVGGEAGPPAAGRGALARDGVGRSGVVTQGPQRLGIPPADAPHRIVAELPAVVLETER